jgi:hypothetical protein
MCPLWLFLIPSTLLLGAGLGLMAWLTPGPQLIGGVTFDIHTMLFGTLGVLLGYQILWMWLFAKIHGWTSGILPAKTFKVRLFNYLNLERGLLFGLGMFATGIAINVWLFQTWYANAMGPLDVQVTFRFALWGFLLMMLGMQTVFGSFFLSMLGMTEKARELREQSVVRAQ